MLKLLSNTCCLALSGAIHATARAIAASTCPRGGDPNRPSQQSRRERGLPTEDRPREPERSTRHRERRGERERESGRERGRDSRSRVREVYRAQSPRQPRFPPPGIVETWETRRLPRAVSDSEESVAEERARDRRRRSQTPSEPTERSRSRPRGRWQKCWVWVPEGGLSPVRDDSREQEEGSQDDEIPEEEVELEGESVDTVTGEPRETRRTAVGDIAHEVPGASPEVASGVDFSATEDSIARQATEEATEHSVSLEPESIQEKARELRSRSARPTASKPSPSISEDPVEVKPPVEKRVKPPPQATSAKAKTRREQVEASDIGREESAVGALRRAIGRDSSRQREGETSSGSGLKRVVEDLPTPPPVPTKEEIEQTEAARKRELESLPPPPPVPREPPVPVTIRPAAKPKLTEEIQPVVLAPRPKERPQPSGEPSPSTRPPEPIGAPPPAWQDKPLVLLDFHKTLSFPNNDPPVAEATVQTLRTVREKGFAIGILSFASNKATQEGVSAGVAELERRLG